MSDLNNLTASDFEALRGQLFRIADAFVAELVEVTEMAPESAGRVPFSLVFEGGPSPSLRYATLGLLFTSISVGGTLTRFAAPPVVMVATRWGWDTGFMMRVFGWKALLGIVVATALYWAWFRGELATLRPPAPRAARSRVPAWIIAVHLGFLVWTVLVSHALAIGAGRP